MNSVFNAYSKVYGVAMMQDSKFEGDVATAKAVAHVRRPSFFGRIIGR